MQLEQFLNAPLFYLLIAVNPQKPPVFSTSAGNGVRAKKTWIVLAIALLFGTASAIFSLIYLKQEKAALHADAGRTTGGQTVTLVVAKRGLRRGEAVTKETAAVREIPVAFTHSLAIDASQFDQYEGHLLAYAVKPGELILKSSLQGGATSFSSRVELGRRAVTMSVDEISSISGLLEPGDLIDLIATIDQGGRRGPPLLVLQGVAVMATGQRSVNDPRTGEARRYTTVTLNTTPDQARNVITARELGKLTALLRNPADKPLNNDMEVDVSAFLKAPVASLPISRPAVRASSTNTVDILYGTGGGNSSGSSSTVATSAVGSPRTPTGFTPNEDAGAIRSSGSVADSFRSPSSSQMASPGR